MTFEIFEKCINVARFWRSRNNRRDYEWPDSRDPDLVALLEECEVVSQDLEKALVALAAFRHAEDGVYQSISCLVHLIRNRQNEGLFRSHLTDKEQFPRMTEEHNYFLSEYPKKTIEFEKVLANLDDILQGKTVDITQGSIYFGIVGDNMPQWFTDITRSPEMERTVKINNTTFYRKKK